MKRSQRQYQGESRVPPRTWLAWVLIFAGIILLMVFRDRMESQGEVLTENRFQQLVESNQIAQATITYSAQNTQSPFLTEVAGKYYKTDRTGNRIKKNGVDVTIDFRAKVRLPDKLEEKV